MLGDTAVAVNPTDERYTKYKGQAVILPLMNREIPFIQDDVVDPAFGTGVVKVTPAHDPADFEMGQRHNLPQISVIGEDAKITSAGGPYSGLDRREARKRVLADLEAQGLLARTEPFTHNVGHCQRCHTVVEPLLSTQWFVRIQPLAESAIAAVEQGRTEFVPPKFANDYFAWMRKIRDWCISRQLWWGHRIPAWYCEECGEIVVSRTDVSHCSKCSSAKVRQDEDVLDTWFSSGLWPFSTLGWPDETYDLKTFYPTTLLITAYDIIFFWVARMMMFGLKFMHEVPFKAVYITGIVRDAERQKMSKSKGNVVDPLEICDRYGTDAVRFALARMGAPGTDIAVSDELLDSYRAFATKVWNAARLIFRHVDESERLPSIADLKRSNLGLVDRWILSRLARVTERVNRSIELYNLHEAARNVYDFFKHEFCDWYLEMIKLDPERSKSALLYVFESTLRLLHPFMPFITEELWQNLPHKGESIVIAPYPEFDPELADESAESQTELVQDIIVKVRNIRAEMNVDAKQTVPVRIAANDPQKIGLDPAIQKYLQLYPSPSTFGTGDGLNTAGFVFLQPQLEKQLDLTVKIDHNRGIPSDTIKYQLQTKANDRFNPAVIAADVKRLPFASRSVDYVICCETLEHVANPIWTVNELARVCRRRIFVTIPWLPETRINGRPPGWPQEEGHVFEFSEADFVKVLTHTSVRMTHSGFVQVFPEPRNPLLRWWLGIWMYPWYFPKLQYYELEPVIERN